MRVLIADDHCLFRDGITSLLEAAGYEVIGQAADGRVAVQETMRLRPDLVLLDLAMPGMDGLQALSQIKQCAPETQVVVLTASDDDAKLLEAVRMGAQGFLHKDLNSAEFLDLLEGLERRQAVMTRRTMARLMEGVAGRPAASDAANPCLTERELELLQWVAQGYSNRAIGQRLDISENTVKYHLKNILRKLGAQNRTEAVTNAIDRGLLDRAGA